MPSVPAPNPTRLSVEIARRATGRATAAGSSALLSASTRRASVAPRLMQRKISGFQQDELGDWVAELECHHRQHVRHRPPFQLRAWVETAEGRHEHVETTLDCPLCDRAELPEGLIIARTAGPFDESSLPAGLRRDHRVADGTWGRLRVVSGSTHFTMQTETPFTVELHTGDSQPIPPGVVPIGSLSPPARSRWIFSFRCALGENRTPNLRGRNPLLYPLSYEGVGGSLFGRRAGGGGGNRAR